MSFWTDTFPCKLLQISAESEPDQVFAEVVKVFEECGIEPVAVATDDGKAEEKTETSPEEEKEGESEEKKEGESEEKEGESEEKKEGGEAVEQATEESKTEEVKTEENKTEEETKTEEEPKTEEEKKPEAEGEKKSEEVVRQFIFVLGESQWSLRIDMWGLIECGI